MQQFSQRLTLTTINLNNEFTQSNTSIRACIIRSACSTMYSIYSESTVSRIPSIAVAADSHVFICRQLRPYRKWSSINKSGGMKRLTVVRDRGMRLSSC